jgi:hypothetical protein
MESQSTQVAEHTLDRDTSIVKCQVLRLAAAPVIVLATVLLATPVPAAASIQSVNGVERSDNWAGYVANIDADFTGVGAVIEAPMPGYAN